MLTLNATLKHVVEFGFNFFGDLKMESNKGSLKNMVLTFLFLVLF